MCGIGFEEFLPGCEVTYAVTPSFKDVAQLERSFGTASTTCPIEPSTVAPNSEPSVQGSDSSASSGNDETGSSVATYAIRAFPGLFADCALVDYEYESCDRMVFSIDRNLGRKKLYLSFPNLHFSARHLPVCQSS
jgi:hypothetical protein